MYRAIITPMERNLVIELPEELVGKPVEVLAFDITADKLRKPTHEEIKSFYANYQVDMSDFKFNRNEANER